MLSPDVGGYRIRSFVPVTVRINSRRGIIADMRVHIDDARRHVLSGPVDDEGIGRRSYRCSHCGDFSIAQQDRTVLNRRARRGHDGRISN